LVGLGPGAEVEKSIFRIPKIKVGLFPIKYPTAMQIIFKNNFLDNAFMYFFLSTQNNAY
jgi:hypothetical protein